MGERDLIWRKASRSTSNGGSCVEVALVWRKASRSTSSGGSCVEVAVTDRVLIRDSKDRAGPVLGVAPAEWRAFLAHLAR
jgi:hypothetical protein